VSPSRPLSERPRPDPARSAAFGLFREIQAELDRAANDRRERIAIAGLEVQMSFGSSALAEALFPAFAHLRHEPVGEPALSISLHDLHSAPGAAAFMDAFSETGPDGDIWVADSPDLSVVAQANGRVVSVIDWQDDRAYWLSRSAEDIPYLERAGPLRHLLCRWLGQRERYFIHAAAVGLAGAGVLILGESGSGKSTTALSCLDAGLAYAGDDHCIVSAGPEPMAHSLFSAGKLDVAAWNAFPAFISAGDVAGRPEGEKGLFFFNRLPGARLVSGFPLRALLLAQITGNRQATLRKVAPNQAFKALVPSCALHFQQARAQALQCFSALARRLPAYRLELGSDLSSSPAAIARLLTELANQGTTGNAT
jgi:hypothetical protein